MRGRWGYLFLALSLAIVAGLGALVAWRLNVQTQPTLPAATPAPTPVPAPKATPTPSPKPTAISTMIDLPGDPVGVSRGAAAPPRAVRATLPLKLPANAPKADMQGFFVMGPLVANDGGYMGKFPEGGGEADALAAQIALNTAVMAQVDSGGGAALASDDDGGDETPVNVGTVLTKDNSNALDAVSAPDGEPQVKQAVLKAIIAQKIGEAIAADGFTIDSAADAEAAMRAAFNVQTLRPGSVALLVGAHAPGGGYRATQFALYQDGDYVGAVALADNGLFAESAKPNLPDGFLDGGNAPSLPTSGFFNVEDGLYSAGLRNGAPEPVVREVIGLLGTLTDLHQPVRPDTQFRALYAREARNKATGGGRIVYAGLSGGGGAFDCYVFEGADGQWRCFGAKGGTAASGPSAAPLPPQKGKPAAPTSGSTMVPVQTGASSVGGILAPIKGAPVTSLFGMRFHPILHILRLHGGLDFGAPVGSPVRASADGKIEIAGPVSGFGNHIRIQHAGFETSYSHLSEIPDAIKPGVNVKEGEIIALSGNTGLSTGPHLHYEYYLGGTVTDPMPHMGTEVSGNIMAGAGQGLVNPGAGGVPMPPVAGPVAGPSEAELAGFPAFKALIDNALDSATH